MKKRKLKGLKEIELLLAGGVGLIILICPKAALDGVREGIKICVNSVVPSLFPYMAVSAFIARSSAANSVSRLAAPVMRHLFHLPGEAAAALLFGLTGGFPVGCSVTAQLFEQGRLSREQAQRLTLFCINSGPAFAVTAVGTVMLGSGSTGVVIFASLCLSALLIGVLLRFTAPTPYKSEPRTSPLMPTSLALVESAEHSARSMIKICAWVVLFSCLFSLADALGLDESALTVFSCICEVTSGCRAAAETGNVYVVTATLGWSGLCVICQVLGDVRRVGTPLSLLLAFRALHAGLAVMVCRALLLLFPIEVSVFSSFSGETGGRIFSASAPASVALICLCAVFVIDLDRNKKMC